MVGASPSWLILNSAPLEVLFTVSAVTFHLSRQDEPSVKLVLRDHWLRPLSGVQVSKNMSQLFYSPIIYAFTYCSRGCSRCMSELH